MVKVVFASHGSLGDLVPFLEIGKVLLARGHHVTVATHAAHASHVASAGLTHRPMRPDRPRDAAFHARFMHPRHGAPFVYRSFLGPAIADSDADLMDAVRGADVLVSVTLALAAPIVAARTGLPWRSAAFQPSMLFSAVDPPKLPMLPFLPGRVRFNEQLLGYARKGTEGWVTALRKYRREVGLGEYPDHPVFHGQHAPGGILALYSPLFGAVPSDAPPGTVQTGQVLQSGGPELERRVATFLADGPSPLVFTLGSASSHAAQRFFVHAARIARRLGARALMLVGREENGAGIPADPSIMVATAAPYERVFPRASLVVHQGGIGTIALCLAAGVPMVAVPFAHDQPDNAARAARLGAARVVPRWRFAASARVIEAARSDATLRAAARDARNALLAERGVERAADAIIAAAG
ncbi:glycosyltransferase [Acuticoccus sp.]|uniref:glycosyltransferase n=1 Tax=Acuticoccus sp. TaxID=1904378 RepID=UPI003B52EEF5